MTNKIEVLNVSREFSRGASLLHLATGRGKPPEVVHALDSVDLQIQPGEVVGIVGESGCGKSTLGRIVAGLLEPSRGSVLHNGLELVAKNNLRARRERLKVQMIFQDPTSSLNPRMRVRNIVGEAPLHHGLVQRADLDDYVARYLRMAGLDPEVAGRLPHEFSGGQRQRIGIARALAVQPEVLVCDESVAALDVSIQAQILNLLMTLRTDLGLTCLFISHDLGVVEHISDRVVVMYLGRVVEEGTVETLFDKPAHPYTSALLSEVPRIDTGPRIYSAIQGEIPSPISPPKGCHFHPRCPFVMPICKQIAPKLQTVGQGHRSACHLNEATEAATDFIMTKED